MRGKIFIAAAVTTRARAFFRRPFRAGAAGKCNAAPRAKQVLAHRERKTSYGHGRVHYATYR